MSAYHPKRTKADAVGLSAMCPNSCRQLGLLDKFVGARDELHKRLYLICINAVARKRDVLATPQHVENRSF